MGGGGGGGGETYNEWPSNFISSGASSDLNLALHITYLLFLFIFNDTLNTFLLILDIISREVSPFLQNIK